MKKTLLFIFVLAVTIANAQFSDDIENYPLGTVHTGHWTSWSGNSGAEDAIVSDDFAFSGTKSILIEENTTGQDAVLDFGQVASTGLWYAKWQMYIPTGSTGYFNVQGNVSPNANANLQFLSGNITMVDGTLSDDNANGGVSGSFPHDAWFEVAINVDMDSLNYTVILDGTDLGSVDFGNAVDFFDGLDFFADNATNRYYIDDIVFSQGQLSVQSLETLGFNSYPNPVKNNLTLSANENITKVSIYNVIGQEVKSLQPNALSTEINMSNLDSGAYFVKVNIGDTVGTIKVIK